MKIHRHGHFANQGDSHIDLVSPTFEWSRKEECIILGQKKVDDFSSKSTHDYKLYLTVSEINNLLNCLSVAAIKDPHFFEESLTPSLKAVTQLQSVVSGLRS